MKRRLPLPPKLTSGRRLRQAMNRALAEAGEDAGYDLEFDAADAAALDVACAAADRGAELAEVYQGELAGQARPATLAKLSSEIRGCEKQTLDALAKIKLDDGAAHVSAVRRQAARSRWGVNGVRNYGSA